MNFIIRTIAQKKAVLVVVLSLALGLVVLYFNIDADNVIYNSTESTGGISKDAEGLSKFALSSGTGAQSVTTTNWGASPFDRSSPVMQAPKLIFKRPNLDWPARQVTLNDGRTLIYIFGNGNPKEVEPNRDDYESVDAWAHDNIVNKNTERLLLDFLSNPYLQHVLQKCGYLLQPEGDDPASLTRNFPESIYTTDFGMNSMLYIDLQKKGQKQLDLIRMNTFDRAFSQLSYTIVGGGNMPTGIAEKCLSPNEYTEFLVLEKQFRAVQNNYYESAMLDWPVSSEN